MTLEEARLSCETGYGLEETVSVVQAALEH
jgi:hypothetical protein